MLLIQRWAPDDLPAAAAPATQQFLFQFVLLDIGHPGLELGVEVVELGLKVLKLELRGRH